MRCGRGNPRTCRVSQTAALLFDLVAQEPRLETESAVPASTTPRSSGFRGHRSQHTDIVEHHLIPVPGESENYFSLAERSRAHLAQHESLASAKDGQESPCRYPSGDAVHPLGTLAFVAGDVRARSALRKAQRLHRHVTGGLLVLGHHSAEGQRNGGQNTRLPRLLVCSTIQHRAAELSSRCGRGFDTVPRVPTLALGENRRASHSLAHAVPQSSEARNADDATID